MFLISSEEMKFISFSVSESMESPPYLLIKTRSSSLMELGTSSLRIFKQQRN